EVSRAGRAGVGGQATIGSQQYYQQSTASARKVARNGNFEMNHRLYNAAVRVMSLLVGLSAVAFVALAQLPENRADGERSSKLDPAAWGADHVGRPQPEFVSGDECLFCHRAVGSTWSSNRHHLTVRSADAAPDALAALHGSATAKKLASEIELVLGGGHRNRFLKSTGQYGRLALLTTQWLPPTAKRPGALIDDRSPRWDDNKFANQCAGCHATAVNPETRAFAAISLDCCTCHGDVDLKHSKDTSLVHLSKARGDEPRVVASICGQCHIRTGKSRSLGSPYANNIVAGDNLFRDLQVDWSDKHLDTLNHADRHVLENIRDSVVDGKSDVTCLSCHNVHKQSHKKHRSLAHGTICSNCHDAANFATRKSGEVHSKVCGY
ncbi:MAG: hypothetical protein WD648_05035, partial [Planctomycetaceae bacterium]